MTKSQENLHAQKQRKRKSIDQADTGGNISSVKRTKKEQKIMNKMENSQQLESENNGSPTASKKRKEKRRNEKAKTSTKKEKSIDQSDSDGKASSPKKSKREQEVSNKMEKSQLSGVGKKEKQSSETNEKKKKKKLKTTKKEKEQKMKSRENEDVNKPKKALEYLTKWKDDRESWSFCKSVQVWLLKNMYDPNLITDSNFAILLEYLEGLKGKGRDETISKAEQLLESEEDGEKSTRPRQVLQLLT